MPFDSTISPGKSINARLSSTAVDPGVVPVPVPGTAGTAGSSEVSQRLRRRFFSGGAASSAFSVPFVGGVGFFSSLPGIGPQRCLLLQKN